MIRLPKLGPDASTYIDFDIYRNTLNVVFKCRVPGQGPACIRTDISGQLIPVDARYAERCLLDAAERLAETVGRRLVFGE